MPAGVSEVSIANMALAHISKGTIQSLTENSTEAKKAKLFYETARMQALEAFNWDFARRRATLALHGDDPPEGEWEYRYQLPADCIAPRKLVNPLGGDADAVPFEKAMSIDGTTACLLTDLEDAVLIYTFDQRTPALFSPAFVISFSYLLAFYLAAPLTTDAQVQKNMWGAYVSSMSAAAGLNANQSIDRKPRDAEWIRGR
jgi:hypothetical protein